MNRDEEQVKAAVKSYAEAWVANDVEAVKRLWDTQSPEGMTFIIIENDTFLLGLPAVNGYFDATIKSTKVLGGVTSDPVVRILNPDTAYAICTFDWKFQLGGQEHNVRARASFILRKRADQWLFQHMHESINMPH